jgi:hypothetical protein
MVKLERDPRNVFQPKLTEEQIEKARKIAGDAVDVSIGQKMEGAARTVWAPQRPSGDGNGDGSKPRDNTDLFETLHSAFKPKVAGDKTFRTEAANRLSAATLNKFIFEPAEDGVGYDYWRSGHKEEKTTLRTARDIAPLLFGDEANGINIYDTQYKNWLNNNYPNVINVQKKQQVGKVVKKPKI